jgi:hypothetical protein
MSTIMNAQPWVPLVAIGISIFLALTFIVWVIVTFMAGRPLSTKTLIIGFVIVVLLNSIVIPNSLRQYVQNKKAMDAARRTYDKYKANENLAPSADAPEQSDAPKSRI